MSDSLQQLQVPVSLEDVVHVEQVNVVGSVDVGNLKTLLQWIVGRLKESVEKEGDVAGCQERLVGLEEKLVGGPRLTGALTVSGLQGMGSRVQGVWENVVWVCGKGVIDVGLYGNCCMVLILYCVVIGYKNLGRLNVDENLIDVVWEMGCYHVEEGEGEG